MIGEALAGGWNRLTYTQRLLLVALADGPESVRLDFSWTMLGPEAKQTLDRAAERLLMDLYGPVPVVLCDSLLPFALDATRRHLNSRPATDEHVGSLARDWQVTQWHLAKEPKPQEVVRLAARVARIERELTGLGVPL